MPDESNPKTHKLRNSGLVVTVLLWLVSPGAAIAVVLAAARWIFNADAAVLVIIGFALMAVGVGAAFWRFRVNQTRFEQALMQKVAKVLVDQEDRYAQALPAEIKNRVRQELIERDRSAKQLSEMVRQLVDQKKWPRKNPSS